MSWQLRPVVVLASASVAAVVVALADTGSSTASLLALAAAVVVGELIVLHPIDRSPLPVSFAIFTVLARGVTLRELLLLVVAAEVVAMFAQMTATNLRQRLTILSTRCAEGFAAGAVYYIVMAPGEADEAIGRVLIALILAAAAPVVLEDAITLFRDHKLAPVRARGSDVAIVTSGVLMAIGYVGIGGEGRLGLWGPILFAVPLVAAWYSFELLGSTRKSYEQTIDALATAPELGGLVREGHASRVAGLSVAMARSLDLSASTIEHLHTAALLHHLGAVCLDEPAAGSTLNPADVAMAGAKMLRASDVLAPAGDVVAAEPLLHRPPEAGELPPAALSGMILKVASAYDELTEGNDEHAAWAVEALYTGPGYVYDGRVLGALERALERRGALPVR